jgi:hypothetical protein
MADQRHVALPGYTHAQKFPERSPDRTGRRSVHGELPVLIYNGREAAENAGTVFAQAATGHVEALREVEP